MSDQVKGIKRNCHETSDDMETSFKSKKLCLNSIDIVCPITKEIFYRPVTCNDGFTYEKFAVDKIFKEGHRVSPMTREHLTSYCENKIVFNLVRDFLEQNPEYKSLQFKSDDYYDYTVNRSTVIELVYQNKFTEISKYHSIVLSDHGEKIIDWLSSCADDDVIIKIIDNSIDYNVVICKIFLFFSKKIILHVINKGCELYNLGVSKNDSIVHLTNKNDKLSGIDIVEIIGYLIDNNKLDYLYANKSNISVLEVCIVCMEDSPDMVTKIINSFNLNSTVIFEYNFIKIICAKCSSYGIELFLRKLDELTDNDIFIKNIYSYAPNSCDNIQSDYFINYNLPRLLQIIRNNKNITYDEAKNYSLKLNHIFKNKIKADEHDEDLMRKLYKNMSDNHLKYMEEFMEEIDTKMTENTETKEPSKLSGSVENLLNRVV